MIQGNGLVISAFPNLVVKPDFGEAVLLPPNVNFSAGEYIWITFKPSGDIDFISNLTDDHIQKAVEPPKAIEPVSLLPNNLLLEDWDYDDC